MAHSKYYDENRNGQRNSIDDATPEEWNAAARKDREWNNPAYNIGDVSLSYSDLLDGDDITYYTGSRESTWDTLGYVTEDFNPRIEYKYSEDRLINELQLYVDKTYGEHYSQNKYQATEFIIDGGHGMGFCLGNILKYAQRYGHKDGCNRKDLMKVLHYALIALHCHDLEHDGNTTS